jgi:hypothetical protein
MSAPAFTRGPWLIHSANRGVVPAADTFKTWAAALPICLLRDPDERLTEDETLANGFLIAAAPELYSDAEFLCARVRELENDLAADETARNYYGHVIPALARMESALAKARGEQ